MSFWRGVLLVVNVLLCMQSLAQIQVETHYNKENKEADIYYDIQYIVTSLPPVVRVTKYASDTGLKRNVVSYEAAAYDEGRGVKEGEQLWYNNNGQLVLKAKYTNNMLHDSLVAYYSSGKIRRIEIYRHGVMTEGNVFAEDGTLLPYQPRSQMPQFPGGERGMFEFIYKKMKYPKAAVQDKAYGTVFLAFVVSENGRVRDVVVKEGVHPALDAEAIRLIKAMPVWKPAVEEDVKVATAYHLPIHFNRYKR